jgi:hypothetical protein
VRPATVRPGKASAMPHLFEHLTALAALVTLATIVLVI